MGSSQQIPQNGLRLVVGMVGKQDARAAMLFRAAREKFMSCVSRGGFHRFACGFHPRGHIDAAGFEDKSELSCQPLHKNRISRGCPPPQSVVEMTNDEISKSVPRQQVQQRD